MTSAPPRVTPLSPGLVTSAAKAVARVINVSARPDAVARAARDERLDENAHQSPAEDDEDGHDRPVVDADGPKPVSGSLLTPSGGSDGTDGAGSPRADIRQDALDGRIHRVEQDILG